VTHYPGKNHHKKGLVEWFKVSALSSNPSAAKKKKKSDTKYTNFSTPGTVHLFFKNCATWAGVYLSGTALA
jgi:hypothetical protein